MTGLYLTAVTASAASAARTVYDSLEQGFTERWTFMVAVGLAAVLVGWVLRALSRRAAAGVS